MKKIKAKLHWSLSSCSSHLNRDNIVRLILFICTFTKFCVLRKASSIASLTGCRVILCTVFVCTACWCLGDRTSKLAIGFEVWNTATLLMRPNYTVLHEGDRINESLLYTRLHPGFWVRGANWAYEIHIGGEPTLPPTRSWCMPNYRGPGGGMLPPPGKIWIFGSLDHFWRNLSS